MTVETPHIEESKKDSIANDESQINLLPSVSLETKKEVPKSKEKEWLSPSEAAEYSGLSKPRIYHMIAAGIHLNVKEIPEDQREPRGPTVLVSRDSLDTYLANRDRPREKHKVDTTKLVQRGPAINVNDEELEGFLNVTIRDLLRAYKLYIAGKALYTPKEAARETGLPEQMIKKMCDLEVIECNRDEGGIYIPEHVVKSLKEKEQGG